MGVSTVAKLKGQINERLIAEFLEKRYNCKVVVDVKEEIREKEFYAHFENTVKEWYHPEKKYINRTGFIVLHFSDEKTRALFYSYSSVNFHENLDFFEEKGLGDMVKSETTYLSMSSDEEAIEIIKTIAKYFGGWYCSNDCDDDYCFAIPTTGKEIRRIDIMTDIETLGKGDNPAVFQIAACAFDISTGNILETFNVTADVTNMNNIEGDTLIWWLKTNKDLLLELLLKGKESGNTERDIVWKFCEWVEELKKKYIVDKKKVFLWGNGILFDNRIIKKKCDIYNAEYPIYYRCDRDMRTILELAATKMGYEDDMEYKNTIENVGVAHDAFDDVKYQIQVVSKAYNDIMENGKETV